MRKQGALNIYLQHFLHRLEWAIDEGTILPCNTRVGDEDIKSTVKLIDDFVNGGLDRFPCRYVDLVGLAYLSKFRSGTLEFRGPRLYTHT